jgi:MFS-type transporter involved in bile tolerance (Atg22 family)
VITQAPGGQSRTERLLERCVVLFAQAMVALGGAVAVYGFLVAMFFFCCGVETLTYFHPARSPLGAAVTIAVVWPLVGFLCVALQGGPGELLDLVARAVRRVVHGARSQRKV